MLTGREQIARKPRPQRVEDGERLLACRRVVVEFAQGLLERFQRRESGVAVDVGWSLAQSSGLVLARTGLRFPLARRLVAVGRFAGGRSRVVLLAGLCAVLVALAGGGAFLSGIGWAAITRLVTGLVGGGGLLRRQRGVD